MKYYTHIGLITHIKREVFRFLFVINQTLFPPIISSLLYLTIFYFVIGRSGVGNSTDYLQFLIPGLIMMSVINNAFANSSSSVFISRWTKNFDHILTMPMSYFELVLGYVIGSIVRGFVTGMGIIIASSLFVTVKLNSIWIIIIAFLTASVLFSSIGILIALGAEHFEHIGIFNTFFLTPMTMLGGVFYSIEILPIFAQKLTLFNPIFYLVDMLRYGMLGTSDGNVLLGMILSIALAIIYFFTVVLLMKFGWKVKN